MKTTRRKFIATSAVGLIGSTAYPSLANKTDLSKTAGVHKFEFGVASWGWRSLSIDEVIEAMLRMKIRNISLKSMHLPMDASPDELKAIIAKMRDAGLNPYAPGVVYMRSEEEVTQAFEYTKAAGLGMMVGVPNYELLDFVESKVAQYDILLAIHNHGPDGQPYPSPQEAFSRIEGRDIRMGLCMDVSHTVRAGFDPVQQIKLVKSRLFDMHIWDVSESAKSGTCVRPGMGVMPFIDVLKVLVEIGYDKSLSIEYGAEEKDPFPGTIETMGYMKGLLSTIETPVFVK